MTPQPEPPSTLPVREQDALSQALHLWRQQMVRSGWVPNTIVDAGRHSRVVWDRL